MFTSRKLRYLIGVGLLASFSLLLINEAGYAAKKDKNKESYVMTEAELQSQVMSFADRFAAIIAQAFDEYDAKSPSPEYRRGVLGDTAYSIASAFTIAAESDPDVALLDMLVMVTLLDVWYLKSTGRRNWEARFFLCFMGFEKQRWISGKSHQDFSHPSSSGDCAL